MALEKVAEVYNYIE